MLLTQVQETPPLVLLIPAERFFFFSVNFDNDVYSAFMLTNMVLVNFTKAGPFFF